MKFLEALKSVIILFLFLLSSTIYCQSKNDFNKVAVTQEAQTQLTQMATGEGELAMFSAKNEIKGEFVIDITLENKGNVLTVYMVSADTDDIPRKNLLKDKLHSLRFENIKIPKKEKIKFRHTLKF
jgi:hypothetical protein